MPRYFFDTDDGSIHFRDDVGVELANDLAARDQASVAMGEIAKEQLPGARRKDVTMWVRGEDGQQLLQLAFTFAVQPLK